MALSNALFAGLSGLDVNQTKLTVVGNNIANVNTVAFKTTRTIVKPQFYITDSGGSQPEDEFGGANPSQRGLGAVVGAIEKDFTNGTIESTGRATDMAIDGDGFFIVKSNEQKYTRDGTFSLNPNNQLVTSGGDFVQGYAVDSQYNIVQGALTNITIPLGTATTAQPTSNATFEGNLNGAGNVASGASILTTQLLTTLGGAAAPAAATLLTQVAATAANATPLFNLGDSFSFQGLKGGRDLPAASFTVAAGSTLGDLMVFFQQSLGINTTVPDDGDPTTPVPGAAVESDATDPNSARLVITGNLGLENELSLPAGAFSTPAGTAPFIFGEGTNAAGIASSPSGESVHTSFIAYDSLGTPIDIGVTMVLEGTSNAGTTWRFFVESASNTDGDVISGMGTLEFDNLGRLRDNSGTQILVNRNGTGAATPMVINLDFSQMTSLTNNRSELVMTGQDGSYIGRLSSFSIGADGVITGSFTNGVTRTLGQLAMATFANNQGLVDRGGNMYVEGPNSGPVVIGIPGQLGAGKIVAGALELSNVDLSEEFINLIIASTGFSASSRVISTSDQLLTELLNTTR